MKCSNCGREYDDNANFCPGCGEKNIYKDIDNISFINNDINLPDNTPPNINNDNINANFTGNDNNNNNNNGKKPGTGLKVLKIILLILLIGILVFAALFWRFSLKSGSQNEGEDEVVSVSDEDSEDKDSDKDKKEEEDKSEKNEKLDDSPQAKKIQALNSGKSMPSVDYKTLNYKPGQRNPNLVCNMTTFYELEDIFKDSDKDGKIADCTLSQKMLKNNENGKIINFEIYTDPSGKIRKIVGIEDEGDNYKITQYYYSNAEKIEFIFQKLVKQYVPDFASPNREGTRYFFANDVLTTLRTNKKTDTGGNKINNFVLNDKELAKRKQNSANFTLYNNMSADQKSKYDEAEKNMINMAYATLNAVKNSEPVSIIKGLAYDLNNQKMENADVTLYSKDKKPLYKTKTDANGEYSFYVPSENSDYTIRVNSKGYKPVDIYDINLTPELLAEYIPTAAMAKKDLNKENKLTIRVQDSTDINDYDSQDHKMNRLDKAKMKIRKGINNKTGRAVKDVTTDSMGEVTTDISPGMYTVEVTDSDYITSFFNLVVKGTENELAYLTTSKILSNNEMRIVLWWGSTPPDVDAHLFTPNDEHIFYVNRNDSKSNNLDVDDRDGYGPETITINDLEKGSYKYYVVDYTNSSGGNPSSYDLSQSGAYVNVYYADKPVRSFYVPQNLAGTIWEVFEIRNKQIIPINRYYSKTGDEDWWRR